eukprot:1662677-Lingulodinium_polyedra.AAC.1
MLEALLEAAGDPDYEFFGEMAAGVSLGVDEVMPRNPAVFEEKIKWKLDPIEDGEGVHENPNYAS